MVDIGFAGATIGGLLSLLSPCSVMLLPAFFAYAFGSPRQILVRTAIFYLGLVATLVPLGVFASTLGGLLTSHRDTMIAVVAGLVIAAGVVMVLGVPIRIPGPLAGATPGRPADSVTAMSTFLLGTVYAVAGVCAGPILGSVLLLASLGSPLYGAALMALYALGMTLPLVGLAVLWGRLGARGMTWLRPRMVELPIGRFTWRNSWITIISGLLMIGVGTMLLVTDGTARLGGWLAVADQSRIETGALRAANSVPDLWFIFGAIIVVTGVAVLANRESASEPSGTTPESG